VRRRCVWMSFAEPIWASGHDAAYTGRTHDRFRTAVESCKFLLEPNGPFSNRASFVNGFLSASLLPNRGHGSLRGRAKIRRNIWYEAQVLQCPRRAYV
jgi:hypothetical protein